MEDFDEQCFRRKWICPFKTSGYFTIGNILIEVSVNYSLRSNEILTVREGLMIVCKEALLRAIEWLGQNRNHIGRGSKLAADGLFVNNDVYITNYKFKFIGKQLEKRSIIGEYIDFEITRSLGSLFICTTQPLLRKILTNHKKYHTK